MRSQAVALLLSAISVYAEVSAMVPDENCELPNGFKYEACGSGDQQLCCAPEQECISAKPKDGDEQFACSEARKLEGDKVIKVVVLPILLSVGSLSVIAYMLKRWGAKNPTTLLLVAQVALSGALFFSPFWALGFYSVFLAVFVGYAWTSKDLVWWVYRLAMVLQVFQIIAIFGPFETFHVPFSDLSYKANSQLEVVAAGLTSDEAVCSTFYGNYFTLLPIELSAEGVNPNQKTFGYCVQTWLGFVQMFITLLGLLQAGIVFYTAQRFAANVPASTPGAVPKGVSEGAQNNVPEGTESKPDEVEC